MRVLSYLVLLLMFSVASAQTPTILQGDYISNVFGNSNFILNPNAQTSNCTTSGTITCANVTVTNASITRVTTTPLVARSEFNVAITSANGTATWATRAFDQGMKGQNCEARFSYRGFAATSKVHIKQGANTVATLNLTPATDPRIASINFPCGDLSTATTFVVTDTAILAGTNEIGAIYTGLATNMANVAQAEFVGSVFIPGGTNCVAGNASATYALMTGATNCGTATYKGNVQNFSQDPFGFEIKNLKPGYYQFVVNGSGFGLSTNGDARFYLKDTTNNIESAQKRIYSANAGELIASSETFSLSYTSNPISTATFRFFALRSAGSAQFYMNTTTTEISVYRFPTSSELVVTPERQNTWGSVNYTGTAGSLTVRSGQAASSTFDTFSGAAFTSARTLKGKCKAPVSGDNVGCQIENMPVGNYEVSISGLMFQDPGTTVVGCSHRIFETTSSTQVAAHTASRSTSSGGVLYQGRTIKGVFNNTAVANRNFVIQGAKTFVLDGTTQGQCLLFINTSGDISDVNVTITPLDQPSNSALYVQGPVLGAQTGAAIPAGYLGKIEFGGGTGTVGTSLTGGATTYTISNVTPGVYLTRLYGAIQNLAPNTTTFAEWTCTLTDNAALTFNAYDVVNYPQVNIGGGGPAASGLYRQHSSNSFMTTVTSTKNYYVRCAIGASGSGITITAGAELIRIN
jgi:hypothetical protein